MHSRKYPKRANKAGEVSGFRWTRSPFAEEEKRKNSLKLKELRGNVYENKGPAFRSPGRSGNVIENKGSYALKPGILLKIHMLAAGRRQTKFNPFGVGKLSGRIASVGFTHG
jgi:hypothetical protein